MSETIIAILTAIGGLLGGGGIMALILLPQTKRKENLTNDSLAIAALKETLNEVREESRKKDEIINNLSEEKDVLRRRFEDKCEESASAKSMLCVHLGCTLRDPTLGQGDSYLKAHEGETTIGDFTPVNVLLQKLGRKRKAEKLQEEKEEKEEMKND